MAANSEVTADVANLSCFLTPLLKKLKKLMELENLQMAAISEVTAGVANFISFLTPL
jgi:hypothetical protein